MSSKRRIRRKSCTSKRRHATTKEANAHIFWLNRSKGYRGPMDVYACQFCGGYHIGHAGNRRP